MTLISLILIIIFLMFVLSQAFSGGIKPPQPGQTLPLEVDGWNVEVRCTAAKKYIVICNGHFASKYAHNKDFRRRFLYRKGKMWEEVWPSWRKLAANIENESIIINAHKKKQYSAFMDQNENY